MDRQKVTYAIVHNATGEIVDMQEAFAPSTALAQFGATEYTVRRPTVAEAIAYGERRARRAAEAAQAGARG